MTHPIDNIPEPLIHDLAVEMFDCLRAIDVEIGPKLEARIQAIVRKVDSQPEDELEQARRLR